jgi:uncharacterized protein (DUF427 family)
LGSHCFFNRIKDKVAIWQFTFPDISVSVVVNGMRIADCGARNCFENKKRSMFYIKSIDRMGKNDEKFCGSGVC